MEGEVQAVNQEAHSTQRHLTLPGVRQDAYWLAQGPEHVFPHILLSLVASVDARRVSEDHITILSGVLKTTTFHLEISRIWSLLVPDQPRREEQCSAHIWIFHHFKQMCKARCGPAQGRRALWPEYFT